MMVVSRSSGQKPAALGSPKESLVLDSSGKGALSGSRFVVSIGFGGRIDARLFVIIVRDNNGISSFFVRRIEADDALRAERRAR